MRTVAPPPVRVTKPEYSLAAGTFPPTVTVSVVEAPAARLAVPRVALTVVPATAEFCVTFALRVTDAVPLLVTVMDSGEGSGPAAGMNPSDEIGRASCRERV